VKRVWGALLALCLPHPAVAQSTANSESWQPPTLSSERYDEDWSSLADPDLRAAHWTGAFKYIPLGDDTHLITGA